MPFSQLEMHVTASYWITVAPEEDWRHLQKGFVRKAGAIVILEGSTW